MHNLRGVRHLNLHGVVYNPHNTSNPTMTQIHRVKVEFVEAGGNLLPVPVGATQIQGRTPFLLSLQAQHTLLRTSSLRLYRTLRPLQATARPMQGHRRIPRRTQAWARPLLPNLLGGRVTPQDRRLRALVPRVV